MLLRILGNNSYLFSFKFYISFSFVYLFQLLKSIMAGVHGTYYNVRKHVVIQSILIFEVISNFELCVISRLFPSKNCGFSSLVKEFYVCSVCVYYNMKACSYFANFVKFAIELIPLCDTLRKIFFFFCYP